MHTTNGYDAAKEQPQGESRGGAARSESEQPIRFAGSELGARRYICGFFHSADEEYRVLLPFIKEGFERGEKAFHIVDPRLRAEHLRRLEAAGIDVGGGGKQGGVWGPQSAGGYFWAWPLHPDRMLGFIQKGAGGGR